MAWLDLTHRDVADPREHVVQRMAFLVVDRLDAFRLP
jgi:hypothetical protein